MIQDAIDDTLEKLRSGNKHLDLVAKQFVSWSSLYHPVLGIYSFTDVQRDFDYYLEEHSKIAHSKIVRMSNNNLTLEELLQINDIPIETYETFVENVNEVLKSYTDESWAIESRRKVLEKQVNKFASVYIHEEEADIKYRMFQALSVDENDTTRKNNYLDNILSTIKKAELNQVENNKYIVLAPLFKKYDEFSEYLEDYNFREKKKYLKKLQNSKSDNLTSVLVKYTNQLLEDNGQDIKIIQWFFFYLIYGKNEVDIFMVHSILGYKYAGATKLYQKLFCKDHSTAKKDDFLHHTNIFNLQKKHLEDEVFHIYETILHYL